MNNVLKHYHSTYDMVIDFAKLSDKIDPEATLARAPEFSFYTKDGSVHLGGTFLIFLIKIVEVTGLKILPLSSLEMPGVFAVSFEDYAPVESEKQEPIEVKPVDSPAKKRATRSKKK